MYLNAPTERRKAFLPKGFTLLELLLSMAVFASMAAIIIPAAGTLLSDRRLTRGTDQLRAEIIRLRVRSMREGRVMVMRANEGSGLMTVTPLFTSADATESMDQTGSQAALLSGAEQAIGSAAAPSGMTATSRTIELPVAVQVVSISTSPVGGSVEVASMLQPTDLPMEAAASSPEGVAESDSVGQPLPEIYFYPNGTTSNAVLVLSHPEAGTAQVRLRGLTGDATVVMP